VIQITVLRALSGYNRYITNGKPAMSRSIKKTPICGITTAESEKKDKQRASRATRRVNYTATKAPIELLVKMADNMSKQKTLR
jgi:hypothetical protein